MSISCWSFLLVTFTCQLLKCAHGRCRREGLCGFRVQVQAIGLTTESGLTSLRPRSFCFFLPCSGNVLIFSVSEPAKWRKSTDTHTVPLWGNLVLFTLQYWNCLGCTLKNHGMPVLSWPGAPPGAGALLQVTLPATECWLQCRGFS